MDLAAVRLGVAYGSLTTVAVVCGEGGWWRPVMVDGSPMMPSAVWVAPDGSVVAGTAALVAARTATRSPVGSTAQATAHAAAVPVEPGVPAAHSTGVGP